MKKILIVDDELDVEPLFMQRFRKAMKQGDFEFHFSFSAEDALNYMEKLNPADVVLVLSDINMPGMSGLELLKKIKQDFAHLKVVMVTAYDDDNNRRDAMQAGAIDFITKPIDFILLKEKLATL